MKKNLALLVGILILILLIGIGVWFFHGKSAAVTSPSASTTVAAIVPITAPRQAPSGLLEYHSDPYHLSLFYPEELQVKEYAEAGGARTVTFQNTNGSQGFQIFITPYSGTEITPQRLKLDIPTGVVKDQTAIVIDGTPATHFSSTNAILGNTTEVWFIRGGFLYEVTTHLELDTWLGSIMQTWKFI